jgi:hypothetical protein
MERSLRRLGDRKRYVLQEIADLAESKQTKDSNESLIIGVVFMWIGSALIASDMSLGTWFTAGPMMLVPALSTIWVFVLSLQRFRFRHLAAGLCSLVLPLIGFIANGCRV